ncbi:TetR/AcrR family transcriptional regulator [Levilactobacillus fujinensis]|uniref:TetR/AcrR family transcriptional regulator n=1 Tax=Levilactobacillus fujinensis TaxID=2486024 RepID=A0ABW1TDK3_9LACO|nr:TetR family transcriptional regulator [Levilactobacillus fujinensis]
MEKTDRRVVKTLRLIDQTCYRLLITKTFERLSVAEICQEAQIGRSTFYQYYLDKFDWLEKQVMIYTTRFQKIMTQRQDDFLEKQSLTTLVTALLPYKDELQVLLRIHVSTADLTQSFQQILRSSILGYLNQRTVTLPVPLAYLQEIYATSAMTYICYELENGLDDQISFFMNESFNLLLTNEFNPK